MDATVRMNGCNHSVHVQLTTARAYTEMHALMTKYARMEKKAQESKEKKPQESTRRIK